MKKRVRAIIIHQNLLLLIKRTKGGLVYWVFPGGGVGKEESQEDALIRECKEELGLTIEIENLFLKRIADKQEIMGNIEYFYLCKVQRGKIGTGEGPEYGGGSCYVGKYDLEWIDVDNISNIDLKPTEVRDLVYKKFSSRTNILKNKYEKY